MPSDFGKINPPTATHENLHKWRAKKVDDR